MKWLSRQLVEAIHADQLREHGGLAGLRTPAGLESALEKAPLRFHYEPAGDLPRLGAAYAYGLCQAHAFVDGNQRVSLASLFTFLGLNGWELEATEPEAVEAILGVAAGQLDEEELAEWIRSHLIPWT